MSKSTINARNIGIFMRKNKKGINNLYKDRNKMTGFLGKVTNKLNMIMIVKDLSGLIFELKTIISILTDWKNGLYRDIETKTVYSLIGVLLYFIMPFDLTFDGIPFIGFLDDMFVVSYVCRQFLHEIEKYKLWKSSKVELEVLDA